MDEATERRAPRRSARSLQAEAAFRARLVELGATLLEPEWLGNRVSHRVRCAGGHDCTPRPQNAMRVGICRECTGSSTKIAEEKFRALLAEIGATLLEPVWLGAHTTHRALCPVGHECTYTLAWLVRGSGCKTCGLAGINAGKRARAEKEFRSRLAEVGATLLEPAWLGALTPHRVRCADGHEVTKIPASVQQGQGVCRVCGGNDPATAEAAFRSRLEKLGATLLEPQWLGTKTPHRVICIAGHECRPLPHNALRWGVCLRCRGWNSDAFYVLTNEDTRVLKLGITSGDGRHRLNRHAADGFTTVHRFLTGLPDGLAPEMERHALAALRLAGERPVQGREYFPSSVRPLVLDFVDNYPTGNGSDTQEVSA
ncbi:hypothetical protein ACFVW5_04870 [Streptomyces sp. NPDC058232]|uniref:hypothetical protein n=1 Tax=Streptomyces sp. NPDC058232 TaxID=3346393 RepID=UPI0036E1B5E5